MGSYWQMVLDHLGCRMFPSFIKEEKSERALIITATREILRGTWGMMQSLSSTFSRQLSQFPKHANHALELCVKHQVRNSMTNMWWWRCCFHRSNDCLWHITAFAHTHFAYTVLPCSSQCFDLLPHTSCLCDGAVERCTPSIAASHTACYTPSTRSTPPRLHPLQSTQRGCRLRKLNSCSVH